MANVVPRTWNTGEAITASLLNKELKTNLNCLYESPYVSLSQNEHQNVSATVHTAISWNKTYDDTHEGHDGEGSRYYVPWDGVYLSVCTVRWEDTPTSDTGVRLAYFRINGGTRRWITQTHVTSIGSQGAYSTDTNVVGFLTLAKGWYVEVMVAQSTKTSLNISENCFWEMCWISNKVGTT